MIEEILITEKLDQLKASFSDLKHILWVGALSFEERCKASIIELAKHNIKLKEGIFLDYRTKIYPPTEAEEQRNLIWDELQILGEEVFLDGIRKEDISPYLFQSFENFLENKIENSSISALIIDITCLTKIHAIAAASILARVKMPNKWGFTYSIPENYGTLDSSGKELPAWRDIIIAPLAETGLLFYEESGRGIIIPGHEADRLIISLGEIEPAGGIIIIAHTQNRPDLKYLTLRKNQQTISQLTKRLKNNWEKQLISITDLPQLCILVRREIELARQHMAPVILFPFGPKSILFAVAYLLTLEYSESSWFVYPIPTYYDADYSSGIEKTFWFLPKIGS